MSVDSKTDRGRETGERGRERIIMNNNNKVKVRKLAM